MFRNKKNTTFFLHNRLVQEIETNLTFYCGIAERISSVWPKYPFYMKKESSKIKIIPMSAEFMSR